MEYEISVGTIGTNINVFNMCLWHLGPNVSSRQEEHQWKMTMLLTEEHYQQFQSILQDKAQLRTPMHDQVFRILAE